MMRIALAFTTLALISSGAGAAAPFQWLIPARYEPVQAGDASTTADYFDLRPGSIETASAWCAIRTVVQKGDIYEITADCTHYDQKGRTVFSIRPVSEQRILVAIKAGSQLPGPWNPTFYERPWLPTRIDAKE